MERCDVDLYVCFHDLKMEFYHFEFPASMRISYVETLQMVKYGK
jgi:hypothetical protein